MTHQLRVLGVLVVLIVLGHISGNPMIQYPLHWSIGDAAVATTTFKWFRETVMTDG